MSSSTLELQSYIRQFSVIQAEVIATAALLNVTVLLTFTSQCTSGCREKQLDRLRNASFNVHQTIDVIYDGNRHSHTVSLIGKLYSTIIAFLKIIVSQVCIWQRRSQRRNPHVVRLIIEIPLKSYSFIVPDGLTTDTTAEAVTSKSTCILSIVSTQRIGDAGSIFDITYKLESSDLITNGDFESGPITNESTVVDLSAMVCPCQQECLSGVDYHFSFLVRCKLRYRTT